MGTTLITGGHAGLGFEASSRLATRKENLVLAGRDLAKVDKVASELRTRFGIQVWTVQLDLASLDSVRSSAAVVRKLVSDGQLPLLDALVCNAGAQFQGPISYSKDGFEETFATNQLGNFLLVNLLFGTISEHGRIIFTASGTHDPDKMDGKSVGKAVEPDAFALANEGKNGKKAISGGKRYTTSKLCIILFAYELDRRLKQAHSSISSIAFDPGFIPETGLARTAPPPALWLLRTRLMKWFFKKIGVTMGSLPFSGDALARIAVDPKFAHVSGQYIQSSSGVLAPTRSSRTSYDRQKAIKLWSDSETLVKLQPAEHLVLA